MTYNADDPEQVEKAQKEAELEKFLQDEAIRALMANKAGRSWIWEIFVFADIWGNPHVPGVPDATSFNVGMANLAKMIWNRLREVVPESALLMIKESEKNENPEPTDAS